MADAQALRAALEGLNPEQQKQLLDELEKRRSATRPGMNPYTAGNVSNLPFASATGVPLPIQVGSPAEAQDVESGIRGASGLAALTGGLAGGASVLPFLPRVAGGAAGASEGYKRGGVPGAVIGGVGGAALPGITATGLGAEQGYETGGAPGAVGGALLGALFTGRLKQAKRILDLVRGARGAAEVATEGSALAQDVAAARRAAQVARATPLSAEKQALVEAARARRAQQAAEAVNSARARGAVGPSRVAIGAEKAGRRLGLTKEEVRQQAGPVLGEALGEASPILPKQALQKIIDTMKPMSMAEREAYVARATSGKAQWQVENIRRTLEHLGLLLPLGAAAALSSGPNPESPTFGWNSQGT